MHLKSSLRRVCSCLWVLTIRYHEPQSFTETHPCLVLLHLSSELNKGTVRVHVEITHCA